MSQTISCIPTGKQLGSERFPDKHDVPVMKAWRCELTALSQLYNLYFVAVNDTIHIHQPSFPDQCLLEEPVLILHPPVSREAGDASGIDTVDPHSVTRLLIAYLGSDEILLLTCDDGDVVGYRVQEIQRVVEQQIVGQRVSNPVRFFLHRNVGASAWGLAVHQAGRIIVVSANTHEVTVLAYALSSSHGLKDCMNDELDSESDVSVSRDSDDGEDFPSPRRRDHVLILKAKTNIPCVSFDNTGADPDGKWLLSTSICGSIMIWNLHRAQNPPRIVQMGWCVSTRDPWKAPDIGAGHCACPDRASVAHAVWCAVMLDVRSAYECPSEQEATWVSSLREDGFWEFKKYKERFKFNFSTTVMLSPSTEGTLYDDVEDQSSDADMTVDDLEAMSTSDDSVAPSESSSPPQSMLGISSAAHSVSYSDLAVAGQASDGIASSINSEGEEAAVAASSSTENHDNDHEDSLFIPELPSHTEGTGITYQQTSPPIQLNTALPWFQPMASNFDLLMDTDSDESDEIEMLMPSTAQVQVHLPHIVRKQPYCEIRDSTTEHTRLEKMHSVMSFSSPCLVLTKEELFLRTFPLPQSSPLDPRILHQPIRTIRRPLHPGPWAPFISSYDRLCFFAQIPELGIFIVASPVGRAAIFSIYYTQRGTSKEYGFWFEYLLPFAKGKEEEAITVTKARLAGIAVAPVQGMGDKMDAESGVHTAGAPHGQQRRWRLLMYYTDHTLISYEIDKKKRSGTPAVGDLVV